MKRYVEPNFEIISNCSLDDVILVSGIKVNESNLGFEGDEAW